jgi:enoyl-CoA hydratase/carnithine racemase
MPEPLVRLEHRGRIAVVSLNRPERHNALVPELLQALLDTLRDPACRRADALVLRAEGRSFSTGGDLLGFWQHREAIAAYARELVGLLNEVVVALYTHACPVACAVQGQVSGGSLGLLLTADRVFMHRDVRVRPYYASVGFGPDGGWTALLPAVIGRRQASHWLHTDATHDAATCLALGLAQQVVDGDCTVAALTWAEGLPRSKPGARARVRPLLNHDTEQLKERLEAEREAFVAQIQTDEALDGIDLFLENH